MTPELHAWMNALPMKQRLELANALSCVAIWEFVLQREDTEEVRRELQAARERVAGLLPRGLKAA